MKELGIFNILWNSVSNVIILLIGILIFKESISIQKYIGVFIKFY